MWKTGGEVDIKSRNQVTIFEVTTNITILFAIADDSSKKSAIIRCWFLVELVSEGECLVGGHGPSVFGDGADDGYCLFSRVDSKCWMIRLDGAHGCPLGSRGCRWLAGVPG